jgi:hypothetical protein
VEEIFGWLKTVGGMRKTRFIGQGTNLLSIAKSSASRPAA